MGDVTPFLWFDDSAEAAITFYTGLIPDSEIMTIGRYPDDVPGMGGKVMHAQFRLAGAARFFAVPLHELFGITVPLEALVRRG